MNILDLEFGRYWGSHHSVWDTTKAGSATNTIVLPIRLFGPSSNNGYVNEQRHILIDWGDDSISFVTSTSSVTHVYPAPGIYDIKISGEFSLVFNNGGDCKKLLEIKRWGGFSFINNGGQSACFFGCSNLILTNVIDAPAFIKAGASYPNLELTFAACTAITTIPHFSEWNWNNNVGVFDRCFNGCTNLNQDLSAAIPLSHVDSSFSSLLNGVSASVFSPTNNDNFIKAVYQRELIGGWAGRSNAKTINLYSTKRTSASVTEYTALTTTYGWSIPNGGLV